VKSDAPFVSVVVPVLNGEETIRGCLGSLLRTDYPADRRELVVVDNGSTDRTEEIVRSLSVRCVAEPRRGLSHARNRGVAATSGDVVAFIDCDCFASTHWLSELVAGLGEDGAAAAAGEVVAYPPTTPAERYMAVRKPLFSQWTGDGIRPWFQLGNAALRREVFDRIGLFDPRFSRACENIDFSWRFLRAGFEFRRRPRAVTFHRHRVTAKSLLRQYYGYGHDQAVLLRKYEGELDWGWRRELEAWKDLGSTVRGAARASSADRSYASYDVLLKLGQRAGFLSGLAASR
jgi:mycofactocin glycosyltransferase